MLSFSSSSGKLVQTRKASSSAVNLSVNCRIALAIARVIGVFLGSCSLTIDLKMSVWSCKCLSLFGGAISSSISAGSVMFFTCVSGCFWGYMNFCLCLHMWTCAGTKNISASYLGFMVLSSFGGGSNGGGRGCVEERCGTKGTRAEKMSMGRGNVSQGTEGELGMGLSSVFAW